MSKAENEQQARVDRAREIGLFRYMLIREAADSTLSRRQRGAMIRAIAAQPHTDPTGRTVRLTRWTLDRWVQEWRRGGVDAPGPHTPPPQTRHPAVAATHSGGGAGAGDGVEEREPGPNRGTDSSHPGRPSRLGSR